MFIHRPIHELATAASYFIKTADVVIERIPGTNIARAVDRYGNELIESEDHRAVIQKTIDYVYSKGGGDIYIFDGKYVIKPVQRSENWFVGLIMRSGVRIRGAGMGKTILVFSSEGASGRVDGISFDEGDLYDIEIRDMTIDGGLIDWGKIGYGDGIRPVNPTNSVNNALLENLELKNWNVGWGIAWGYTTSKGERLTIRNIWGENLGRGVVWIANQDHCFLENIFGKNIIGYSATGEGDVVSIESGEHHNIVGIFGVDVPRAILSLSGTIRTNVSNVNGSTKLYGIRLININHANITNVKIDGDPSTTYGIYWSQTYVSQHVSIVNANLENHKYGLYLEGNSTYYIQDFYFSGRILSWNANQSTAIYMRYVKYAKIALSMLSWGYGTLFDVDYADEIEIDILRHFGVTTASIGANVTNMKVRCRYGPYKTINGGTATFTGDGSTTQFKIAHGLVSTPKIVIVTPKGSTPKPDSVDWDDTYIYINYSTAPAAGTTLVFSWFAEC